MTNLNLTIDIKKLTKGLPLPVMTLVVPLMKKQPIDNTEDFKNLLEGTIIYVDKKAKTVVVVGQDGRKAISKATENDTFDTTTGVYYTFVKYLTNWSNSYFRRYLDLRLPSLERNAIPEATLEVLKKAGVKDAEKLLADIQHQVRTKVEKEISIEVVSKLTGMTQKEIDAYVSEHTRDPKKK
jgi:hypothetical protein